MTAREHWDRIYRRTVPSALSWYQPEPTVSLDLIRRASPDLNAPIIDVGGGESTLVDALLDAGYRNVTVLDLSDAALKVARERLRERAALVRDARVRAPGRPRDRRQLRAGWSHPVQRSGSRSLLVRVDARRVRPGIPSARRGA
jgi:hypothetical protein